MLTLIKIIEIAKFKLRLIPENALESTFHMIWTHKHSELVERKYTHTTSQITAVPAKFWLLSVFSLSEDLCTICWKLMHVTFWLSIPCHAVPFRSVLLIYLFATLSISFPICNEWINVLGAQNIAQHVQWAYWLMCTVWSKCKRC